MNDDPTPEVGDKAMIKLNRLRRKLAKRDIIIAALTRENEQLKNLLAVGTKEAVFMAVPDLKKAIERAVSNALCNVRMIPILGLGRDSKILEVRVKDE